MDQTTGRNNIQSRSIILEREDEIDLHVPKKVLTRAARNTQNRSLRNTTN